MQYGQASFWEGRYRALNPNSGLFDWYCAYLITPKPSKERSLREELLSILLPSTSTAKSEPSDSPEARRKRSILVVGCGISSLGESLALDGFTNVCCVDRSPSCISFMRARNAEQSTSASVQYEVADVEQLSSELGNRTFDVIIDKAMLDAIQSGGLGPFARAVGELYASLAEGGTLITVSVTDKTSGIRSALFGNPLLRWEQIQMCELVPPGTSAAELDGMTAAAMKRLQRPYYIATLSKAKIA